MPSQLTASQLYNFFKCPYRLWQDLNVEAKYQDPESDFARLLWEKGTEYEQEVLKKIGPVLNIEELPPSKRAFATLEAMYRGEPLIYQGVLEVDHLKGVPDLLEKQADGTYMAVDIKSGRGLEGETEDFDGRQKQHYALQLSLYTDALIRLGLAREHRGKIIDVTYLGSDIPIKPIDYDLDLTINTASAKTYWQQYLDLSRLALMMVEGNLQSNPALSGICKMCHWYSRCKQQVKSSDDMTQVFELGRNVRDKIIKDLGVKTVKDLASLEPEDVLARKAEAETQGENNFLEGLGEKTLKKFLRRARLYQKPKLEPEILEPIYFPTVKYELYFDIEDDPMRDLVYLHGIYVREFLDQGGSQENFLAFVAREVNLEAEKKAWQEFWTYIRSLPKGSWCLYYYSKHERTVFRNLAEKYPAVASLEEVENLFDPTTGQSIDLYFDIIKSKTDWPLYSYSVKSIAQFLGFAWRDVNPSGAASIEWFSEYVKNKDPEKLQRILDYNEDDCKAMMIIKDSLVKIQNKN